MPPILTIPRAGANSRESGAYNRLRGNRMARSRKISCAAPAVAGFLVLCALSLPVRAQVPDPSGAPRVFQEQDAVNLTDRLRQALESESRSRMLKLFDASRMPGFALFRDEITQFFEQYQAPRIEYRISQVSRDGALGAVVGEFVMEAEPRTGGQPALHRRAQVRLVTSWDGKEWKIADLSPRSLFR
jgi:hypothetical protein